MNELTPYYQDEFITLFCGDARDVLPMLPANIAQTCITSPPYFQLRNYGIDSQIGLEATPAEFVAAMLDVFGKVRRVLRSDATLFLNLGDSYAGSGKGLNGDGSLGIINSEKQRSNAGALFEANGGTSRHGIGLVSGLKPKDLIGIPWRVAFALQDDGWWLRQDIIWNKKNPMPESVTDRCTKSHEYIFLMAKAANYYFDNEAIKEPIADATIARMMQDIESQNGSDRVPGTTNGNMKAVLSWKGSKFHTGKTAEHQLGRSSTNRDRSLPRNRNGITGSLDIFDGATRNKRSVWTVSTKPFKEVQETSHLERVQADAVFDGTTHITFPSCPVCADQFGRAANVLCDEREADVLSRIERIGSYLVPELAPDFVPTVQTLVSDSWRRNSGSARLRNFLSASGHSTRSHKKAREILTSLSYTSFVQTLSDIPDKLDGLLWSVLYLGTHGNNISLDGMDARLLVKIPHCIADRFSCSYCQLYQVKTTKTSHFATYPPDLIEPMILAGSRRDDTILEPFAGAGTTLVTAKKLGRKSIGIELNPDYCEMIVKRIKAETAMPLFD